MGFIKTIGFDANAASLDLALSMGVIDSIATSAAAAAHS